MVLMSESLIEEPGKKTLRSKIKRLRVISVRRKIIIRCEELFSCIQLPV